MQECCVNAIKRREEREKIDEEVRRKIREGGMEEEGADGCSSVRRETTWVHVEEEGTTVAPTRSPSQQHKATPDKAAVKDVREGRLQIRRCLKVDSPLPITLKHLLKVANRKYESLTACIRR